MRLGFWETPLYLLVLVTALKSLASDCDLQTSKAYLDILEKGLASESVWKSVPGSEIRFLISDEPTHQAFIVGSPSEELKGTELQYRECSNYPGVFRFSDVKLPSMKDRAFAPCDGIVESGEETCLGSSDLKTWKQKTGRSAVIFATPLVGDLSKAAQFTGVSRAQELGWIDFHETFHTVHQLHFKNFYDLKDHFINPGSFDGTACSRNTAWLNSINEEFSDWKSLLIQLDGLTNDQIRSRVKTILDRRCNQGEPSSCWDMSGERTEGLANYFGIETLISSRQMSKSERNRLISSYFQKDLKTGKITPHYSAYGTGHVMGLILDRLQPDKGWQTMAEQGYSPIDLLARIVEPADPICHPTDPNKIIQNSGLGDSQNGSCPK